jgi:Sec-independent protein translocase protein TatA
MIWASIAFLSSVIVIVVGIRDMRIHAGNLQVALEELRHARTEREEALDTQLMAYVQSNTELAAELAQARTTHAADMQRYEQAMRVHEQRIAELETRWRNATAPSNGRRL